LASDLGVRDIMNDYFLVMPLLLYFVAVFAN